MRKTILLVGMLAVGCVVALSAMDQRADAAPRSCLRFREFAGLKKLDERTYLASTKYSRAKYIVTMRGPCRALDEPDNPYTVRLYSDMECFDSDDVLVFRLGDVCFVENVRPAPAG